jgi:hypothetical protein
VKNHQVTYQDLVNAGAPELPHGWYYRILSKYGNPKVEVVKPGEGRRGKPSVVSSCHIIQGYGCSDGLAATARACRDAVGRVEFFAEVQAGTYGPTCTCGCK